MRLKKIDDFVRYHSIIDEYKRKGCLTNDFLYNEAAALIINDRLYGYCGENNAFLFVEKDGFYRIYYYLNDLEETDNFDLPENLVVEILFRGSKGLPYNEVDYLLKCGFQVNLRRDLLQGTYLQLQPSEDYPDVRIRRADTKEEVSKACKLFNNTFDRYTGDYISDQEYGSLLVEGRILMAYDLRHTFLGALHQTVEQNVARISHIAVVEDYRGQGVGSALLNAFVEGNKRDGKSRYALWVQSDNVSAVNMYDRKGFRYSNKSTISMLKINR